MFVDSDLLRMGAGFSRSAGTIAARGADRFASAQLTTGVFGDFDAAHGFHRALCRAHEAYVATMQGHTAKLEALADQANAGAAMFIAQDQASQSAVDSAARDLP